MKTVKSIILIALIVTSVQFSYAQPNVFSGSPRQFESTAEVYNTIRDFLNRKEKEPYFVNIENAKGSPYLDKNYQMGTFYIGDKSYGNILMRFNTYTDEIELARENDGQTEALMKIDNSKVVFKNNTLKVYDYNDKDNQPTKGYFLVLNSNDKLTLLLRKKCVFSPNEKALTANQADRAAKFTQYDYYYVVKDGTLPVRLATKKKAIFKMFPEKKNEIKKYIKSEKLNIKKQADLTKLFKYISSLS